MSKCTFEMDLPQNCKECIFSYKDYASPHSCKALEILRLQGPNPYKWDKKEDVDYYVENELKSPNCPLKPI